MNDSITLKLYKEIELKHPIVIEGFPGYGLVGTISIGYIIKKFQMEQIGYITSYKFPPVIPIHDYEPVPPIRIYADKKQNLVVIISEFVIPSQLTYLLSNKILEFAKQIKAKAIISLGSIEKNPKDISEEINVYALANTQKHRNILSKLPRVKLIKEGATSGVSALMLAHGKEYDLAVVSFLGPTSREELDLEAAVKVLVSLKAFTGISLDLQELENDAIRVEETIKKIVQKAKEAHLNYKQMEVDSLKVPEDPMFG